jgi:subtilase family serine protease
MADLAPQNLSFSPQRPNADQSVLISLDVVNVGSAPSMPCRLALFLDYNTTAMAGADVPALDAGEGAAVRFLWNTTGITAGVHWLRLQVDSGFAVVEGNETNNTVAWMVDFNGTLDLAMDTVTFHPTAPRTGDLVQFSARVMNIGSLASDSANVTLKVQGSVVDRKGLGAFEPRTMRNASLWWNTAGLAPGNYSYEVGIESSGGAIDSDPGNNFLSGQLELLPPLPGPDLRVSKLTISPAPPKVGDDLTLFMTVENIGNLDSGQCNLMVYLETGLAFLKFTDPPATVPPIPAGGSVQLNVSRSTGSYRAGSYTINVTVDFRNVIAELNETNNHFLMDMQLLAPVPKKPVLAVGDVSFDGKLVGGSELRVLAVISNTGDADALGVNVTLIVDNEPAGQITLDIVPAGANRTAAFQWRPAPGKHTIQVKAETEDAPQSTGAQQTITVAGKPDGGGSGVALLGMAAAVVVLAAAAGGVGWFLVRRKKDPRPD